MLLRRRPRLPLLLLLLELLCLSAIQIQWGLLGLNWLLLLLLLGLLLVAAVLQSMTEIELTD